MFFFLAVIIFLIFEVDCSIFYQFSLLNKSCENTRLSLSLCEILRLICYICVARVLQDYLDLAPIIHISESAYRTRNPCVQFLPNAVPALSAPAAPAPSAAVPAKRPSSIAPLTASFVTAATPSSSSPIDHVTITRMNSLDVSARGHREAVMASRCATIDSQYASMSTTSNGSGRIEYDDIDDDLGVHVDVDSEDDVDERARPLHADDGLVESPV